jgi:hypothetical protein
VTRKLAVSLTVALLAAALAFAASTQMKHAPKLEGQAAPGVTKPSMGYDVHVLAPHLVDGKESGPYHHYCKTHTGDPIIVCLIYEDTDPNAILSQVEWIYAKSLTRPAVNRSDWNKNWHDHQVEIAGGRVQVLDMPAEEAKKVADLVYHFHFDGKLPNGKMSIAQAVGHKPLSDADYKKSIEAAKMPKP